MTADPQRSELAIDLGPPAEGGQTPSMTPSMTRSVSAIMLRPPDARWLYVFAHGAGAGMRHPFMETMARLLGQRGVATLRYQFHYVEVGRKLPDPPALLDRAVRAAVAEAARRAPDLALLAGGKSMGGRMTSQAQAAEPLPGVRGLVFFGFPLHPPRKPATTRGDHLARVDLPMLFLQGTRDELAELALLEPVLRPLDRAQLHIIDGADHSFGVPASSGRRAADVMGELADAVAAFASRAG